MLQLQNAPVELKPYVERLAKCINNGFLEFSENAYKKHILSPGCQAWATRDFILDAIRHEFQNDAPQVRLSGKGNLTVLQIGVYLIKIKKLSRNMKAANYPTKQSTLFNNQGELGGFRNTLYNLNGGYILNAIGGLSKIVLTYPNGKNIEWYFELTPLISKENDDKQEILNIVEPTRPRVRVKGLSDNEGKRKAANE